MAKPNNLLTKSKNLIPKNTKQAIIEESSEGIDSENEL